MRAYRIRIMQIRVLGPLEVQTSAGTLQLPKGRKQRLLFSILLLQAPRVVSTERLIELLWEDELPDDPAASLRTQLSRLRGYLKEIGPGATALQSEPHGYRLVLPRDTVDIAHFEALLARSRQSASPTDELDLLGGALDLFRGRPFEEFADHPAFTGETNRLEALRNGATERRVECLIALRRTGDAIVAVEPLLRLDPLRERPRALYMEALYRAGRQHEALSAFQEFRRLFSEELGLEPSPALVRLQAEILKHGAGTDGTLAPDLSHGAPPQPDSPLPLPLTSLIGREADLAHVLRLVQGMRLLTLTGVAGTGKTRLALEAAQRIQQAGTEVVWVALDSITDPAFVPQEIAASLGIREQPGRSPTQALVDVLARRTLLLVLDNCEHLIEACAVVAQALLQRCPGVTILATSREPLGVGGETAWPVPSLRTPGDEATGLEEIRSCESVQLFVDRARHALPGFEIERDNAAAVADICRQVDGMPLCLELAAALVRILPPEEIAARLQADLDVLTSGSRTTLPRHQTLRTAIDWSYDLLSDPERRLLERLAIFSGGFTIAAAEAVCGDGRTITRSRVLHLLTALVDKSLVVPQPRGGVARYRLLQTVRSYAWERLLVRSEKPALLARHAAFYAAFSEEAEPWLVRNERAATTRRILLEQENIRAALSWALTERDGLLEAYRLTGSLWWYWHAVGRFGEARQWAESTLAVAGDVPDRLRARTHFTAAMACWLVGDPRASVRHAERAIALARRVGEPALLMVTSSAAVWALRDLGDHDGANAHADECVEVARSNALPASDLGFALWIQMSAAITAGLAEKARAAGSEARTLWEGTGDHWGLSMILHGLAMLDLERGALDSAEQLCREAVGLLRSAGEPHFIARSIEGLASVLAHKGEAADAARLLGAAEAIRERIGAPLLSFEESRHRAATCAVAEALEPEVHRVRWEEGRALTLADVVDSVAGPAA